MDYHTTLAVIGDIMGLDKLSAASGGEEELPGGSAGSALGIIVIGTEWFCNS